MNTKKAELRCWISLNRFIMLLISCVFLSFLPACDSDEAVITLDFQESPGTPNHVRFGKVIVEGKHVIQGIATIISEETNCLPDVEIGSQSEFSFEFDVSAVDGAIRVLYSGEEVDGSFNDSTGVFSFSVSRSPEEGITIESVISGVLSYSQHPTDPSQVKLVANGQEVETWTQQDSDPSTEGNQTCVWVTTSSFEASVNKYSDVYVELKFKLPGGGFGEDPGTLLVNRDFMFDDVRKSSDENGVIRLEKGVIERGVSNIKFVFEEGGRELHIPIDSVDLASAVNNNGGVVNIDIREPVLKMVEAITSYHFLLEQFLLWRTRYQEMLEIDYEITSPPNTDYYVIRPQTNLVTFLNFMENVVGLIGTAPSGLANLVYDEVVSKVENDLCSLLPTNRESELHELCLNATSIYEQLSTDKVDIRKVEKNYLTTIVKFVSFEVTRAFIENEDERFSSVEAAEQRVFELKMEAYSALTTRSNARKALDRISERISADDNVLHIAFDLANYYNRTRAEDSPLIVGSDIDLLRRYKNLPKFPDLDKNFHVDPPVDPNNEPIQNLFGTPIYIAPGASHTLIRQSQVFLSEGVAERKTDDVFQAWFKFQDGEFIFINESVELSFDSFNEENSGQYFFIEDSLDGTEPLVEVYNLIITLRSSGVGGALGGSVTTSGESTILTGKGTDLWDGKDTLQYASQTLTGDGYIIAKLDSVESEVAWAKAGILVREGLTDNDRGMGLFQRGTGTRTFLTYRKWAGDFKKVEKTDGAQKWLRIRRRGDVLAASLSFDGHIWFPYGQPVIVNDLANELHFGLAVTSADLTKTATATFSNVIIKNFSSDLTSVDIDSPALAGSHSYDSGTGVHTVSGSGKILWEEHDQYQYAYTYLEGDGVAQVKIDSIDSDINWATVGIMFRENLARNRRNFGLQVRKDNSRVFRVNRETVNIGPTIRRIFDNSARYLRIERAGDTFTASFSADGINWTQFGDPVVMPGLSSELLVGLMSSSPDSTKLTTARFSEFSVTSTGGAASPVPTLSSKKLDGDLIQSRGVKQPTDSSSAQSQSATQNSSVVSPLVIDENSVEAAVRYSEDGKYVVISYERPKNYLDLGLEYRLMVTSSLDDKWFELEMENAIVTPINAEMEQVEHTILLLDFIRYIKITEVEN